MPKVSVIIRTKNEERWIGHCLAMLQKQHFTDFEVVLVDNQSTDHTVAVARRHPLAAVLDIREFKPGFALNEGIRASSGQYIVCLSAHCIPRDEHWLDNLLRNFDDERVAGVYGRQLPVSFTDAPDKRDLLITFGQERRVQSKDYFFHNANSMLRRDVWEKFPFDEHVTNIEDRVWGKAVTSAGYQLVYEPDAAVYHHHGLHQGNTPARVNGVVSVIERVDPDAVNGLPDSMKPENVNVAAVIPVQGEIAANSLEHRLLKSLVARLRAATYVNSTYLIAADESLAESLGTRWVDRTRIKNSDDLSVDDLLGQALHVIEGDGDFPESLLYANYMFGFRPEGLFDNLILQAQYKGCDTVFAGYPDYGHFWIHAVTGEIRQIDPSLEAREKREPVMRALYGAGCVVSAALARSGKMVGGKIGIFPVHDVRATLNLRDCGADKVLSRLLEMSGDEQDWIGEPAPRGVSLAVRT